jgi:hypothetical protein
MKSQHSMLSVCLACVIAGGLLAACSKSGPDVPPAPASSGPVGARLAIAGQLLTGDDPAALRAYLQSVKEIQPRKFDVKWNPATVAVGREEAIRALRAISRDGSTYTFASSEPVIATLKAGSILWVWNVAVRKVDSVETSGDTTVVRTRPVALTEALTKAQIEFDSPVSPGDYYMAYRPHRKPAPATVSRALRPGFHLAAFTPSKPEGDNSPGSGDAPQDDWGKGTPASNGFNGELKGMQYSLAYDSRSNGLTMTLEARKAGEGGEEPKGGGDEASNEGMNEKFKEAEEKEKEATKALEESKKQLEDEQKNVKDLDARRDQDLDKLKADQAARKNPNYQGPRPPAPKTDSNGTPLTDQAEQDLLAQDYAKKRNVEMQKMAEVQKIHDEVREKKEKAEALKKSLARVTNAAKKFFDFASENTDVRFRVRADIDNIVLGGGLNINDGTLDTASMQFKDLKGRIAVSFIGRLGEKGDGTVKIPVMDLPIVFNVPFPMGGIPFVVQIGADFTMTVSLVGRNAAMKFEGSYTFNGSGGFHADKAGSEADSKITGSEPKVSEYKAMSPGVSAAVVGAQAPRLGLGLGLLGVSSVAYIDVVHVLTITNSASVGAMLGPLCNRITYTAVGHVGVDTDIMPLPIPFIADKVNKKLSPKKELFRYPKEIIDPPVKACEV